MLGVDFDFARYISQRRGLAHQRARDGAAYAYAGERKVRRTLNAARPVSMAIEATTGMWKNVAKNDLLGTSVRVTDQQFPQVLEAIQLGCLALNIVRMPPVYVAPASLNVSVRALGTNDDAYIVISSALVDNLTGPELVSVIGGELGHIQNNHVVYVTALHYLTHSAMMFVRWIVQPAVLALQAWSRRAEITCDRAALLCTKNLDTTLGAMIRVTLGLDKAHTIDVDDYLKQLPDTKKGIGRYAELFRSHPYLPKRVQALKLFSESDFYRHSLGQALDPDLPLDESIGDANKDAPDIGGKPPESSIKTPPKRMSADELDAQVAKILSVF